MQISPRFRILLSLILISSYTAVSAQVSPIFGPGSATPLSDSIPPPVLPSITEPSVPTPAVPAPAVRAPSSVRTPSIPASAGGSAFDKIPSFTLPGATASVVMPPGALTIDALQRVGLEANGMVRAAQSQVSIAEAGVIGAAAYPNPQLSVVAGPQHARIALAHPATNTRQLTVTQTIENPFMRGARIGSAEAGVAASRASYHQVRADLAAQLRVRAYELVLRQEIARMEESIFDLMQEVRRRISMAVGVGETARFELVRADAEVLNAASRKEAAELGALRARVALMQFTAGALKPDFTINASLFDPVSLPPLEELRQEVPAVNPDVLRLQAEWERARLRIDQERASVLPSVDIAYSHYQDAQYTDNRAGMNVRVPVFYRRRGEIDAAVADSARARETLEFRRYEIGQLFESAWQALQIARRRVEMFEGGIIKEAENALRIAQAAYRFGERPLIDVLDTQRILRGILMDSLQARFDLQAAAAEIDRLRAYYPREQGVE
ncbi:cobalt-zinc-cadmium efflux system outer membrane protein [Nitrosospira sp. Nsp5]|uniref:Outer membrane protein, cobalt-zinc-cadmium efflux system n=2 Tax=Nitrosomonadaceae TaxID=206379 RepID=A0ABY0TGL6_9PROT|nr:cobalt-zinc-cadmium efflux system outer membrane protein [Nitrosospira sp. Nsp5]SDQ58468.1 outer membrane protein, cobalt-zinc-cadmium efflux system [Nitrosospira multiformis]